MTFRRWGHEIASAAIKTDELNLVKVLIMSGIGDRPKEIRSTQPLGCVTKCATTILV